MKHLLALAALLLPSTLFAAPLRTIVYTVDAPALSERHQRMLRASLLAELGKYEGVIVRDLREIDLKSPKALPCYPKELEFYDPSGEAAASQEPVCLNRLAELWDADAALSLRAHKLDDSYVLVLKRIDIRKGEVTHASTHRSRGDAAAYLMTLGDAAQAVLDDRSLRAGEVFGVHPDVLARWRPNPIPKWATLSTFGLTAVSAGLTTAFYIQTSRAQSRYNSFAAQGTSGAPVSGAELTRLGADVERWAWRGNISLIPTIGLALASVVLALLTDWGSDDVWLSQP